MSTITSTAGVQKIARVAVHLPPSGVWRAEVTVEHGAAPTGPATLTIGDLVLVGAVAFGGVDAPDKPHVVLEGASAAWGAKLKPRAYQSDAGVKLSTVLRDLASEAGESIALPADTVIGTAWTRPGDSPLRPHRGRDALAWLVYLGIVPAWYVDPIGVTRFAKRAAGPIAPGVRAEVLRRDLAAGMREIGTENPGAFVPGLTFEGDIIARVVVRETAGKLSVETWRS